jgi:hypothetical protein
MMHDERSSSRCSTELLALRHGGDLVDHGGHSRLHHFFVDQQGSLWPLVGCTDFAHLQIAKPIGLVSYQQKQYIEDVLCANLCHVDQHSNQAPLSALSSTHVALFVFWPWL